MVSTNQDEVRLEELDAADAKIVGLEQSVALLESQKQELIKQQAEAVVAHRTELTTVNTGVEAMQRQVIDANTMATKTVPGLRRWRRGLLFAVPTAACVSAIATFHYHAAIQGMLSLLWP